MVPLNKYLSQSGVSSRRKAVEIIQNGNVTVNGKKVLEPGFKVGEDDKVKVNGELVQAERKLVYILLNKPANTITSTEDPEGRTTVMDLVKDATSEVIYPIGRLDWNTTGVLILTNDGDLNQKLSHPKYEKRKVYEATLDKPLTRQDFNKIMSGLELEDGPITPDRLAYISPHIVEIQIHSGRNRIVRRIFEEVGYDVKRLDRVMFAGIKKGTLWPGEWRFMEDEEIKQLKGF